MIQGEGGHDGQVDEHGEVRGADEDGPQAVDAIGQRVGVGQGPDDPGQVLERRERPREEEKWR